MNEGIAIVGLACRYPDAKTPSELWENVLARRRAFHRHDPNRFDRAFGVVVHEHCEEILGRPACDHYFGLPVDAYEAIERFLSSWGQPTPLGCAGLRCMGEAA